MHDEACPTYQDMIVNLQKGHEFILEEFGVAPRVGWELDSFGHSNTNVRLFA
jgi:alpha-mannosidase